MKYRFDKTPKEEQQPLLKDVITVNTNIRMLEERKQNLGHNITFGFANLEALQNELGIYKIKIFLYMHL